MDVTLVSCEFVVTHSLESVALTSPKAGGWSLEQWHTGVQESTTFMTLSPWNSIVSSEDFYHFFVKEGNLEERN